MTILITFALNQVFLQCPHLEECVCACIPTPLVWKNSFGTDQTTPARWRPVFCFYDGKVHSNRRSNFIHKGVAAALLRAAVLIYVQLTHIFIGAKGPCLLAVNSGYYKSGAVLRNYNFNRGNRNLTSWVLIARNLSKILRLSNMYIYIRLGI